MVEQSEEDKNSAEAAPKEKKAESKWVEKRLELVAHRPLAGGTLIGLG